MPNWVTNTLVFVFPRIYSHRAQRSEDARVWHFPLEGSNAGWLVAWKTTAVAAAEKEAAAANAAAAASAVASAVASPSSSSMRLA